jgi:hypothetical protein
MQLEQRERHHQEISDAAAATRCWERLKWVVETAGIEPAASQGATLGLGPELALELLRGLLREAEELGDDALAGAVTVYQTQLGLVLVQQGGPLSTFADTPSPATDPKPDKQPAHAQAKASPPPDETPRPVAEIAGRRRRQ